MKKLFIISTSLLFLVLTLWGVYNFAFKNNTANPVADPVKKEMAEGDKNIPPAGPESSLAVVVNGPVLGATLLGDSLFFYSSRDHAFEKTTFDGGKMVTLFSDLPGIPARTLWSADREKVLVLMNTNGEILWYFLSLSDKKLTPLKKGMDRLAWTNLGESILYEYSDPVSGKNSLNIANPDGSNWRKLADLETGSFYTNPIPQSSLVSFWKRPNGLETNKLETVALTGDSRKTLYSGRFGTDFLWSKDGNRILIGGTVEKGSSIPTLGLANDQGGEYQDLLIPTLVSKVVWSKDNQTIFYALPSLFPEGTILPNDYFSKPIFTQDTFWKMDVTTGRKERLVPLEDIQATVDAADPFLSEDETSLFFTDRISGKLYRINL